ncbi:hypothetical protein CC86DRAFT_368459 [Ophiobolus disseminans]|uniref:Uncharacterized protein n=1 Tax=Ophiobolus disseminans TaxID=1469910 RepID=A0A6A7A9V6_9PLEO|nr:hypothetical protein CC86DRAFT_368459 [Ophiobolus disseminans]
MASFNDQASERTTFQTLQRSVANATATPSSVKHSSEAFHPFTTYIIAVITDPAQLQSSKSAPPLSQITPPSHASNASVNNTATSSTKSWNITRVGTVVSEADIPEAWGPRYLQAEHARQTKFLIGMGMIFVFVIVMIVGITWWR